MRRSTRRVRGLFSLFLPSAMKQRWLAVVVGTAVTGPAVLLLTNHVGSSIDHVQSISFHERVSTSRSKDGSAPSITGSDDSGALCGGCLMSIIKTTGSVTCGSLIQAGLKGMGLSINDSLALQDAGRMVARANSEHCGRCDPQNCSPEDKIYLRLDDAGPRENMGRTMRLPSIPEKLRLPLEAVQDHWRFFADVNNTQPNRKYLFEYNPSIIPMPPDQIPSFLRETPTYLATFRVTNLNDCYGSKQLEFAGLPSHSWDPSYLAVAFLRSDLSVIYDAVFHLPWDRVGRGDYRIVLLHGQLYLTVYEIITRFWIVDNQTTRNNTILLRDRFTPSKELTIKVSFELSCCESTFCNGKNFNYFEGPFPGTAFAEISPLEPHVIELVNLRKPCRGEDRNVDPISLMKNKSLYVDDRNLPPMSFYNVDELYFAGRGIFHLPYSEHRGTACCLPLEVASSGVGETRRLLVGISHQKIHPGAREWRDEQNLSFALRQYTSNFYAFEDTPPFRIVAVSGRFCLGFTKNDTKDGTSEAFENYLTPLTRALPVIVGASMDCPFIQFVSGMTESATDPSKVILGYGINDCLTRFIEIDKSEILRQLFHPFRANPG